MGWGCMRGLAGPYLTTSEQDISPTAARILPPELDCERRFAETFEEGGGAHMKALYPPHAPPSRGINLENTRRVRELDRGVRREGYLQRNVRNALGCTREKYNTRNGVCHIWKKRECDAWGAKKHGCGERVTGGDDRARETSGCCAKRQ